MPPDLRDEIADVLLNLKTSRAFSEQQERILRAILKVIGRLVEGK